MLVRSYRVDDWELGGLPALERSVLSLNEVFCDWRCLCVLMPSRILVAFIMDMPQKSGTRCTH